MKLLTVKFLVSSDMISSSSKFITFKDSSDIKRVIGFGYSSNSLMISTNKLIATNHS